MPHRRIVAALVLLCAVAGGCHRPYTGDESAVTASAQFSSGVRGTATVDIGCPVLESSSSCPRVPLRARIAVRLPGRTTPLTAVETTENGRFEIRLTPGVYELHGENLTGQPAPAAKPVTITVTAGRLTDTMIEFDSGIRGAPDGN